MSKQFMPGMVLALSIALGAAAFGPQCAVPGRPAPHQTNLVIQAASGRGPHVSDSFARQATKAYADSGRKQDRAASTACAMPDAGATAGMEGIGLASITEPGQVGMAYPSAQASVGSIAPAYQGAGRPDGRTGEPGEAEEQYLARYIEIFGAPELPRYPGHEAAIADMVTLVVPVWNLSGGAKVPSTRRLTVHRGIAEKVALVFQDIYTGPEQFPIYSVQGYAWRSDETSEHRLGTAIDINPRENYMLGADGTVVAGHLWAPEVSIYSIPEDGDVVRAFEKHGFIWGGTAWADSRDYMHFSYFGS